jgi:hypothetical protein
MRSPLVIVSLVIAILVAVAVLWRGLSPRSSISRLTNKTTKTVAGTAAPVNRLNPSAVIQRLSAGEFPRLTPEQVAAYVESQNHSALSLIAAWQLSRDADWLRQAAERYPNDPGVAAAMLVSEGIRASDAGHWIAVVKQSDPDNAFGAVYAAKAALDQHDLATVTAELTELQSLSRLQLPSEDWTQAMTDAYRSAGYGGMDAEWASRALTSQPWDQVLALNRLLAENMNSAAESGDRATASFLGESALKAAALVDRGGDSLLTQLVSVSMERQVLNQMDAFDLLPGRPKLVAERLHEMDQRIGEIKDLIARSQALVPQLTDTEAMQYTRRVRTEGEVKALRWLIANRGR